MNVRPCARARRLEEGHRPAAKNPNGHSSQIRSSSFIATPEIELFERATALRPTPARSKKPDASSHTEALQIARASTVNWFFSCRYNVRGSPAVARRQAADGCSRLLGCRRLLKLHTIAPNESAKFVSMTATLVFGTVTE